MLVENQKIKVRVNNFNESHFSNLGYEFNKNDYIIIPAEHLPNGSGLKVRVICEYCEKEYLKAYRRYLESPENNCCKDCRHEKMMNISLERYGNVCSLRNPSVQEKSKAKNMKNLGVQYPFQNRDILEKCHNTIVSMYGDEMPYPKISKNQKYLSELYGGVLNYYDVPYYLDVWYDEEKIYLEYDGSGHRLPIILGNETKKSFEEKEATRKEELKSRGYKEFRIISSDDLIPNDKELLIIKERGFYLLLNEKYNHYIYNLDTKTESFEV